MTASSQDKYTETAFWDTVAAQRVYAAFDDDEYDEAFDWALGDNLRDLRIVDVGSAAGVSAARLASRGAVVVGIDLSPEQVKRAKELWIDYPERIDFVVGDAENLEIEDSSVDVCFFGGVLHHFPSRAKVYVEALRILKPNGKFVALEPNLLDFLERIEWAIARWRGKLLPYEEPINPFKMSDEMREAGFEQVLFTTFRNDIPFLAQLPLLRFFFSRQKGFAIKTPLLRWINAWRPPAHRGTFFVIQGRRII